MSTTNTTNTPATTPAQSRLAALWRRVHAAAMTAADRAEDRAAEWTHRWVRPYPALWGPVLMGGFFAAHKALGDNAEPALTAFGLSGAVLAASHYWLAKRERYAASADGETAIVAISVNQDVAESVRRHFGRAADVYIKADLEVGSRFLTPEQIREMARKVAAGCLPHRDKVIYLVLAGPAGLCFQVGQLVPAHKFRVIPLSWAGDRYQEIPMLGIDDIGA